MSLGKRIKAARIFRSRSHEQLGKAVGVSREAAWQWEDAKKPTKPTTANLEKIAGELQVSYEWLATGRGEMAPAVNEGNHARDSDRAAGNEQVRTAGHSDGRKEDRQMTEIEQVVQRLSKLPMKDQVRVFELIDRLYELSGAKEEPSRRPPIPAGKTGT